MPLKHLEEQVNHHLLVRMKNFNRTWNRPIRCHATPKSLLNHQFQIKWAVQSDNYIFSNIQDHNMQYQYPDNRLEWPYVCSSISLLEFCVILRAHIASKKFALLKCFFNTCWKFSIRGNRLRLQWKSGIFFYLFSFKFIFLKIENFKQLLKKEKCDGEMKNTVSRSLIK